MSVPAVFEALGKNVALLPAGRLDRSAVSPVIASPSGSVAVTFTLIVVASWPKIASGATTTGARLARSHVTFSTLSAFAAMNRIG